MQIEVRDGSRILWVEEFACFLDTGELAFSYHELPEIKVPDWYGAPEGSSVREERRSNNLEHPDEELRSMQTESSEVLSFYCDCVRRGGLILTENPVADHALLMTNLSRVHPGIYAESADYHLSLEIYEHRGISFWRVKHGPGLPPNFRSKREPKYLILVSAADEKVILRNPDTADELWAPSDSLTNEPMDAPIPKREPKEEVPISWSLVPEWLKTRITLGTAITASSSFHGEAIAGFSAMKLSRDPKIELEHFLDQLDSFGFDPTGIERPEHCYYIRPMTGGRQIQVHVREQTGDTTTLTFVSTAQEPILYAYYKTPRTLEEFLRR